jgi:predicted neuraminidase
MTSTDNGETWGNEREWADTTGWLPRNPPVTLKDGTLMLPMSVSIKGGEGGGLWKLESDGDTWIPLGIMKHGEQLSVIERDNGDLFALARSRPYIQASESSDRGATWSKTKKTELRCPDSGTVMIRLKSGRVVLAHNDNNGEDRSTLALQVSEDEGRTWKYHRILDMDMDLVGAEFSYPCLVQASDGMIHVSYTFRRFSIKHATFNEDWLLCIERPN